MPVDAQVTETKLTASDAAAADQFGASVALSGDTAVVGAYLHDHAGSNSGSAYVFVRSGTTWTEQAELTASDAAAGDWFGFSVALSGDTAVVGAYRDHPVPFGSGSAYVFVRSGTTWTEQAELTASDGVVGDRFGFSVSVSGDTAVVGAYGGDDAGTDSGSAYVFVRSGTTWTEQAKLTASDGAAVDWFGFSVTVSGDTAVVGAYLDDDAGTDSGSAYVFVRSGTTWTEQAKLTAGDAAPADYFGFSVSLSGDTGVVGAYGDDDAGSNSGSAYVFVRSGTTWTEQAKLTASDGAAGHRFGASVSLSGDAAVVGAWLAESAYVFVRTGTAWTEQAKLTASDGVVGDRFGFSVSVSGDTAVVGAHGDGDAGPGSGSAYVFPVSVTPGPNTPPIASFAVTPLSGDVSTTFAVDASSSTDAEDSPDALEVRWDWEDDGTWDTALSTTKTAQHQYSTPGTYTIRLEVVDTGGLTGSATQQVDVLSEPPNQAPVASFSFSPAAGDTSTIFAFDASASSDAEDPVEVLEVRWDWEDDGAWDTVPSTQKTATHQYGTPGTYTVRLEVTDTGDLSHQTTRGVTVASGPSEPTQPSAPRNLQALADDGVVELSWQPPASDGGSQITGYSVYRGTAAGSLSPLVELGDVFSYQDTGVTNGVTYYYQVSAVNSVGEGPASDEVAATPRRDVPPPPPFDFLTLVIIVAVAAAAIVAILVIRRRRT